MALLHLALLSGCNGDFQLWRQNDVVQPAAVVTERFDQTPLAQVDLLFVVDDTGSMAEEHLALAASFSALVSALDEQGLSWQLGVISTDPMTGGQLLGEPWILTSAWPEPEVAFAETVDVGTRGVVNAGLANLALALSDEASEGVNRGFRRPDAALQVVVVSDGDDQSGAWLAAPVNDTLALLNDEEVATGRPAVLSAVVGDVPGGCSGDNGTALPGSTYKQVADATDGVVASICSSALGEVLTELGNLAVEVDDTFILAEDPEEVRRVSVNSVRVDAGWSLERNPARIVFEVAPAAGSLVEVRYTLPPEDTGG
jgi:hypothetical protein